MPATHKITPVHEKNAGTNTKSAKMWTVTIGTVYRTSNSTGLVAGGRGSGMLAVLNRDLKDAGAVAKAVPMHRNSHYFSLLINNSHFA
jgi:hypothetical protein